MTAQCLQTTAGVLVSVRAVSHRLKRNVRLAAVLLSLTSWSASFGQAAGLPQMSHVDRDFGKVPLSFEPNQGQTDARVQFLSRGPGYALFLTPGEAILEVQKTKQRRGEAAKPLTPPSTLRMTLIGADPKASVAGEQLLPGTSNYFVANDPSKWHTRVPTYQRVAYTAVYPGVDLVYYGNQRELEYDFVVAPGADIRKIALAFTGAVPSIDRAGDLMVATDAGQVHFHKPVVYQLEGGRKVPVEGSYSIADGRVHFALGQYDKSKTLVIDPVLSYMTYLGGSAQDEINGMAVDPQGNAIVIGTTFSTDFPLKNAYNSTAIQYNANYPHTMFVSKFNATGTALVYSTFLGESTSGASVAVDPSGNAYAFGTTDDPNYPVTAGAYQTLCGANYNTSTGARIPGCSPVSASGNNSTVVTKISPDGSQLVYSTFLSGNNGNTAQAIAVDAAGEAYVAGVTNSICPGPYNANGTGYQAYDCIANTSNASETLNPNGGDTYGFLVKFNAQGSGLLYSTKIYNHNPTGHYLSGIKLNAIALDAAGNAYVTGNMDSNYFITTTAGALQPTRFATSLPAFVAKFNPAGTASTSLVYSTYLTGTTYSLDYATGIAVDSSGNAVVTGYTNSCTFPTTAGAFSTVPAGYVNANTCYGGGFLSKLNAAGNGLVWSTWTGNNGVNGRNNDNNDAVALRTDGSVYVAGDEQGTALSPTVNPIFVQSESHFAYIKQFKADGSAVVFSTAVGGTTDATSIPSSIFVDPANNIYLAGYTNSATWPTTAGAAQKSQAGGVYDGFVVKIAPTASTTTALTLPAGTVTAGQSVKFSAKVSGPTGSTETPTGMVTFLSGSTTLGTGTLDGTATATYTATSLNATTYNVTASYAGDAAFSPSVSAVQNLIVSPTSATVTLTAPATAIAGSSVTLSAAVTGTPTTPTGMVTFKDGTTTLATQTLVSGSASYKTLPLTVGTHALSVSYIGDSTFAAATSTTQNLVVSLATPTLTLTAPATALVGASVSLSAAVASTAGTPTGMVTFKDGTTSLATATLVSGAAIYSTTALAAGPHSITASYGGDSIFGPATSAASTVTISVPAAITFAAQPASLTIVHGASGTVVITGTPAGGYTGTVSFACGTLPASASCTFAPASLTFSGNNTPESTTLTFSTSTIKAALEPMPLRVPFAPIFAATVLLPLGLRFRRKLVGGGFATSLLLLVSLASITGCGGSSTSPTTVTTAAGTYTVPITITAGTAVSTVNLSVTVQ